MVGQSLGEGAAMRSIDTGLYLRGADDDPEPRIEVRDDGTHVYIDAAPARSKVRDAAPSAADGGTRSAYDGPATTAVELADPRRAASGQQPDESGFKTIDFRRDGRSGHWLGQAGGRRFRLQQSRDGAVFRVTEDRNAPWAVRVGDKALSDPSRALSDEQHQAGLGRLQTLLDAVWRRKGEAA